MSQMASEEDRDNVGHELGGPLRCTDDKLIKDGEGTGLDLPLAGSLDLMEKRRGTKEVGVLLEKAVSVLWKRHQLSGLKSASTPSLKLSRESFAWPHGPRGMGGVWQLCDSDLRQLEGRGAGAKSVTLDDPQRKHSHMITGC
ncbi:hypothetical protein BGY98DRAFT_936909 [Russula aff. rugulosa BPL654]|nr:hypothetical protein BGY98DRAFT_936909 [Russula aff. rugulosa BPL654]